MVFLYEKVDSQRRQSVTVNAIGCGFDSYLRYIMFNIFILFTLVSLEFGGK